VGLRAGPDDVEKKKFLTLPGLKLRPLGRPARSQSLYRLSYLGSYEMLVLVLITLHIGVGCAEVASTFQGAPPSASCYCYIKVFKCLGPIS
jgi:hypothetical protein